MIECKGITLKYNNGQGKTELEALQDLNLEIAKGERCVIIGPSGCGKSSLLYLLSGLYMPSMGHIFINKNEVKGPREEIALILQDQGLFPWKTVMANSEFGLLLRRIPQGERKKKVLELLDVLGLSEHINKFPTQLSGGQRQRVAIARALAIEPQVLLMDEPFSALDALTREELQKLLLDLWQRWKMTLVLVTHNIEEAVFLGKRIIVMSSQPGRIIDIIENEKSGDALFRKSSDFYKQCNHVRSSLEGEYYG